MYPGYHSTYAGIRHAFRVNNKFPILFSHIFLAIEKYVASLLTAFWAASSLAVGRFLQPLSFFADSRSIFSTPYVVFLYSLVAN